MIHTANTKTHRVSQTSRPKLRAALGAEARRQRDREQWSPQRKSCTSSAEQGLNLCLAEFDSSCVSSPHNEN